MAEKDRCPVPAKRSKAADNQPTTTVFGSKLHKEHVKIQAHQICLRALSLVFDHMLETGRKDEMAKIKLTVNPGAFQVLLELFYGDKSEVSIPEALDVLYLADKYGIGPLMKSAKMQYREELLSHS